MKLVHMNKKSVKSSKLKWDTFEVWFKIDKTSAMYLSSLFVIFPSLQDLEKVTSRSVGLGVLRRTPNTPGVYTLAKITSSSC